MSARFTIVIVLVCILVSSMAAAAVEPISMSNRSLGGKDLNHYTLGVAAGYGPNNIGLLVRTWGKVTYVNTIEQSFYVNDGSNLSDGTRRLDNNNLVLGIRVSYADLSSSATPVTPPSENDLAVVTGISSTVLISDTIRPNLRVSKGTDIQILH